MYGSFFQRVMTFSTPARQRALAEWIRKKFQNQGVDLAVLEFVSLEAKSPDISPLANSCEESSPFQGRTRPVVIAHIEFAQ